MTRHGSKLRGITRETALHFLALPNVKVCKCSWQTPREAMDAKDW
jgi:2-dehydro-3-deoxyphosphogluconate aldolase/(4S)-4-hydroxy-2-oxoglutarate aldolase